MDFDKALACAVQSMEFERISLEEAMNKTKLLPIEAASKMAERLGAIEQARTLIVQAIAEYTEIASMLANGVVTETQEVSA